MRKHFLAISLAMFAASAFAAPGVHVDVDVTTADTVIQGVGATAMSTAHSGDFNAVASGTTGNGISSITLDLPQTFNDDVDVSVYTNGLVLQGVGALAMSWSGDATATATALNAVSTIAGSMGGGADSIDVNIASEAPVIQGVGASAIVMSNNSGNDAAVASGTAANSLSSIDVSQVGYADHVGVQVGTGFVQQGVGAFAISQGPATATATALNAVSAININ